MRLCISALLLSLLAIGCMTSSEGGPAEDVGTSEQGLAEIKLDAGALIAVGITQVTLEAGGQSQDLVLNPATGTYDGAMILPSGPQTLVARAFVGATLVGASNPIAVDVAAGEVTRVLMRILDLTGSTPPVYGPILDSLVYPAAAQAMAPVTFTASVVAPVGDPITYAWSSSCADSTFSAPGSATTSWSKDAQGACTISLLATSNGISIAPSFQIVVFPAGSGGGAVDVSATFITAPTIYLSFPDAGCFIQPGGNSSCAGSIASPSVTSYGVSVTSWGGSTPGAIALSDNCGGQVGFAYNNPDGRSGSWLPPTGAGVCILTASAVNGDGLVATLPAAILVHAGTPSTSQPPAISGAIFGVNGCQFASGTPVTDCGAIAPGTVLPIFASIGWQDGLPGSVSLLDDCAGGLLPPDNAFNFSSAWTLSPLPGTCTLTILATSLQGATSEASAQYHLQ